MLSSETDIPPWLVVGRMHPVGIQGLRYVPKQFGTMPGGEIESREAGGTRAIVTNIVVDLDAPTTAFGDDEPFHLRCAPDAAAERLQRLVGLGYDDAVLLRRMPTEKEPIAMRALLPH